MNFELNEDQAMLRDTVASFVKQTSPVSRARRLRDDPRGWDPLTWKQMGELGWLSVPFPESVGGFGGSFVDVAVILERFGTTLVPEPYLASVVLAGLTILRGGSTEQHARFLTPMIEGKTSLALAYAERGGRHDVTRVECHATPAAGPDGQARGYRIDGEKVFVLNGHAADHVVVSASTDDGLGLFVVDAGAEGLATTAVQMMDGRRGANLRLVDVFVSADARLGGAEDAATVLGRTMDYGAAAACAEGLGVVTMLLEMTTEYLKEREQFGAPIGTFQALQHRAVDMFVDQQQCVAMNVLAAIRADEPDPAVRCPDISAAKAHLGSGGKRVAQQALQLHGGVGITDEHDIGLFFKRLGVLNALFGDEEHHVSRFMADATFTAGI
ncbi:MAG: acyl-CoA dehydrogenase family protein [Deltaproteobacteria bacterium]|nr:acyl-CoA dehydrogenase family protein [Deltaproteobacteria bacterium]